MKGSKSIWNIAGNYGSKFFSLISVFIFIPLYIKYLGVEAYAVIGFYSLLLGIISFADSGLSSSVVKEFSSSGVPDYKYSILRLIEKKYILICLSITVIIYLFSPLIAEKWLTSETIPKDNLIYYLRLIGIGISLQLLSSLYFGAIFGLSFQIEANLIQIIWNISKSFLVVLALIFINRSLEVFFIWQIACNLIYVLVLRFRVIFHLKKLSEKLTITLTRIPKPILQYIGGMIIIALISAINSQADKIVTSSFFSLKVYGYYTIASTLAQIPVMIAMPMTMSLFPVISRMISESDTTALKKLFTKSTFILNNFIFVVMCVLVFYTKEVILLWTHNSIEISLLPDVLLATKFLVVGSSFLALQLMFFYVLLSFGKTKYNVYQGIAQIAIGIPILYFFINRIGMAGGGVSWILINFGGLVFLFIIVLSNYVKLNTIKYLIHNLLMPIILDLLIFAFLFYIYKKMSLNFIFMIFSSSIISIVLNVIFYNMRSGIGLFSYKGVINLYKE